MGIMSKIKNIKLMSKYELITRKGADRYQGLFNFFSQEHNLTLTISEMDDIIHAIENHKKS